MSEQRYRDNGMTDLQYLGAILFNVTNATTFAIMLYHKIYTVDELSTRKLRKMKKTRKIACFRQFSTRHNLEFLNTILNFDTSEDAYLHGEQRRYCHSEIWSTQLV